MGRVTHIPLFIQPLLELALLFTLIFPSHSWEAQKIIGVSVRQPWGEAAGNSPGLLLLLFVFFLVLYKECLNETILLVF